MLPKERRFTTELFDRCFKKSKKVNVGPLLFLVSESRRPWSRFSVVVGKKYSKLAVKRNRLRRQMYEIMRRTLLLKTEGKNVICLYKGDKNEQNSGDLERFFIQFSRIKADQMRPPFRKRTFLSKNKCHPK